MGFYITIGLALAFNIIFGIFAILRKSEDFTLRCRKLFIFHVYLAITFFFYETYSEDIIFRIYSQEFTNQLEQYICYISMGLLLLQPLYLSPILWFTSKEQTVEQLGELPFSFYYLNFEVHSKKHLFMQIPIRMILISVGNLIKVIKSTIYPFYLIGQFLVILVYNIKFKPFTDHLMLKLDCANTFSLILSSIILEIVSSYTYISQESIRSQVSSIIIYAQIIPLLNFSMYYLFAFKEWYHAYKLLRAQQKRVIPIDVFLQQTKSYQKSTKIINKQQDNEEMLISSEINSIKSKDPLIVSFNEKEQSLETINKKVPQYRGSADHSKNAISNSQIHMSRFSLQNGFNAAPKRRFQKETSILPIYENKEIDNQSSSKQDGTLPHFRLSTFQTPDTQKQLQLHSQLNQLRSSINIVNTVNTRKSSQNIYYNTLITETLPTSTIYITEKTEKTQRVN